MPAHHEIELKGTIRSEHLGRVKDLPVIKSHAVGQASSRDLVTVYFDTTDHKLRQRGLSLRIRKVGGAYVQCVKQAYKQLGGISVRTEWEGPVPRNEPAISVIEDKSLRRLIRRAGVEHLQPVFRTEVQRSSQKLELDDDSKVTLDIDVGEIVAENASEPICEFELELESGLPGRLFDLASEIRKVVPFRLSTTSKASRGYALLTQDEFQPRRYVKFDLAKDTTVEQAMIDLVQHCINHLQANEAVVMRTDDAEGIHQMRSALRRLRAALRLFKPSLPKDQYGWAVAEAKWLTAELSAVRAWDVFADEFVAPVAQLFGDELDLSELMAAVEHARRESRGRARAAIGTERYTEFLLRLTAWLSNYAWRDQPVTEGAARLLDPINDHYALLLQKQDRNVRKQGRNIENLSEAGLHELRLGIKGLSYALDLFESLHPKKRVKGYRRHLGDLQDELGYLSDVAAADTLLRELGGIGGDQKRPVWAYVGGLTVGWHRHHALAVRQKLIKDMASFLRTEPFCRGA